MLASYHFEIDTVSGTAAQASLLCDRPMSAAALPRGQLAHLTARGWDVHLACAPGAELSAVAAREGVTIHEVPLLRETSVLRGIGSLCALLLPVRRVRPDVLNAGTSKAGLLGTVSAWLTRVDARVYVVRGLRLEGARAMSRTILAITEIVACRSAHTVVRVSESLQSEAIAAGVVDAGKARVIGHGSSNRVDVSRFAMDSRMFDLTETLRELGLLADAPTVRIVGRLTRAIELLAAFACLYAEDDSVRLLVVGDAARQDPLPQNVHQMVDCHPGIDRTGFVGETAPCYHLMDVLCLPTHCESFPNAPLEAAAAGVSTITTTATGARDSMVHAETGLIGRPGDSERLALALRKVLNDQEKMRLTGESARERVERDFKQVRIWSGPDHIYGELLQANT